MAQFEVLHEFNRMTVRAANGCVTVDFPDPQVVIITCEGIAYETFVEPVVDEIEVRCHPPIILAVDAGALSSYETGFRKLWTQWVADHQPSAVLILSGSRLVSMGISLANAMLGGTLRAFNTRAEFEEALAIERERSRSTSASV